jgi:hypothetical protein
MAKDKSRTAKAVQNGQWGWILFMAYIGALIYFFQRADNFWGYLLSFLQAAVWPAYVLHAVLKLLNI